MEAAKKNFTYVNLLKLPKVALQLVCTSKSSEDTDLFFHAASEQPQVPISNTFDQILVYPQKKNKLHSKVKNAIPSHLSSSQMIEYFEQKACKKS